MYYRIAAADLDGREIVDSVRTSMREIRQIWDHTRANWGDDLWAMAVWEYDEHPDINPDSFRRYGPGWQRDSTSPTCPPMRYADQ